MMATAEKGRALRDAQMDMFEVRDALFLDHCRIIAAEVAAKHGSVSINDIRARVQVPATIHPSVLGAVFRSKKFKAIGYTEATHPQAHARVVRVYQLT